MVFMYGIVQFYSKLTASKESNYIINTTDYDTQLYVVLKVHCASSYILITFLNESEVEQEQCSCISSF